MAFPLHSWEALLLQKETCAETQARWQEACNSFQRLDHHQSFNQESFTEVSKQGYRCEVPCRLLSEQSLKDEFQMDFKDIEGHASVETVQDEYNMPKKGVMLRDGEPRYYLFQETTTVLAEEHNSVMLRSSQGRDIASWFRGEMEKAQPLGRHKGKWQMASSLKELSERIRSQKALKEEMQALASTQQQADTPKKDEEEIKSDASSEIEYAFSGQQLKNPQMTVSPRRAKLAKVVAKLRPRTKERRVRRLQLRRRRFLRCPRVA